MHDAVESNDQVCFVFSQITDEEIRAWQLQVRKQGLINVT